MRPIHWYKKRKHAGMPVVAELVLDMVSGNDPMTITNLVNKAVLIGFASHSTIHNSLAWLKSHGYIKTVVGAEDDRLRVCTPTDKAKRYLG